MHAHLAGLRAVEGAAQPAPTSEQRARRCSRAPRRRRWRNIFGAVVAAADAGCTHGEICGTLRRELGFGQPLVVV